MRGQLIDLALKQPELSPCELAVTFADERAYFVSEASVYRLLRAHGLITSPAFAVMKTADEFHDKTTAPNQLWQTDFTYLKVTGWGWFYLSTILNENCGAVQGPDRAGSSPPEPRADSHAGLRARVPSSPDRLLRRPPELTWVGLSEGWAWTIAKRGEMRRSGRKGRSFSASAADRRIVNRYENARRLGRFLTMSG